MKQKERIQKKLDLAQKRIEQMRRLKERIENRDYQPFPDDLVRTRELLSLLEQVDLKASKLMFVVKRETTKLMKISDDARKLAARDETKPNVISGLGKLVGGLGKGLATTVQSITDGAVPITKSIVNSAGNVAKAMTDSATSLSGTILKTATGTAKNLVDSANNTASSIIGQTSNLASSLTSMTSNAINKIAGEGTDTAKKAIQSILNPEKSQKNPDSGEKGIGISSVLNTASSLIGGEKGLVSQASGFASDLLSSVGNIVNGSDGSPGLFGSVSNLAGGILKSASGFANTLLGSSASSLIDGAGGVLGGLFGSAADIGSSALAAGGNAVSAATDLLGGLADGCASLAGDIASSAGSAIDSMTNAATSITGSMMDAATDLSGSLIGAAGDVAGSVLDAAGDIGGAMMDTIGDLAGEGGLVDGLMDFAGDALGAATDLAGDVIDAAADLASDAIDLASDVADGIVDAASNVADALFGDTEDDVGDIMNECDEGIDNVEGEMGDMNDEFNQENWDGDWNDEDYEDSPYDYGDGEGDEGNVDGGGEGEGGGQGGGSGNSNNSSNENGADNSGASSDSQSTVPSGWDSPQGEGGTQEMKDSNESNVKDGNWGWKPDVKAAHGLAGMMHDGDQQLFNPYGHGEGLWTVYSFRPCDAEKAHPQIAITPSSFQALDSMNTMLNSLPYVVVKEYFFKNTASTMLDFVKRIMGAVQEAKNQPNDEAKPDNSNEVPSGTAGTLKEKASTLMNKIKEIFYEFGPDKQVIEIPYLLYVGLRKKMYGNTYIFPYIVDSGTLINQASNNSEWNGESGGLWGTIKKMISGITDMVGGIATSLMGSQAKVANLFPAPTWGGMGSDKVSFSFDLMLVNDNALLTRNNYMCVNTIIHNNRSIQKSILAFPGALYEIWLPTGQRHLMCTGDFKLYPLGLNRFAPTDFFKETSVKGATFKIGTSLGDAKRIENPHNEKAEVIPDGYKLSITFTSCLANNMNSSVFQYYVKMTGYENYGNDGEDGQPGSEKNSEAMEALAD